MRAREGRGDRRRSSSRGGPPAPRRRASCHRRRSHSLRALPRARGSGPDGGRSSRRRCRWSSSRTPPRATARSRRSTRGWAGRSGSARTTRRCSTACAGWREHARPRARTACFSRGPIDLKRITAQALQMGDECHNRNVAATSLLTRAARPGADANRRRGHGGERPRLPARQRSLLPEPVDGRLQGHPGCRPRRAPASTVVTAMARNGVEFGIRVSGTGDAVVHRSRPSDRRPLFPGLRPGRRQSRPRRQRHHRDGRDRGLRDGRRAGDRALRRRHPGRRDRLHARDVRHHADATTRSTRSRRSASRARRPGSTSVGSSRAGWPR